MGVNKDLRASIEVSEKAERSELGERWGKVAPWGGSVSKSLSSFCIRRFSLAACAIDYLIGLVCVFGFGGFGI